MATRMQQRRGTAEQWLLADPVLATGEIGFETDTGSFKIGDGVNSWLLLEYFENAASFSASLDDYVELTSVGIPNGVAALDSNGFVPASQLDIDLSNYYTSTETDTAISTAVSNVIDAAPGVLDTLNELAAAIGDDADFATTITNQITNGDSATLTSAQNYADGLASNYDPAGSAATAETNANNYTDAEISALDTALKTYADQAETDAVSAANSYTDTNIGLAINDLVDAAPEALNTLNELSAALNDDANFATTITNSIATKAPLDSPSFTGTVNFSNSTVQGLEIPQPIHPFVMLGA